MFPTFPLIKRASPMGTRYSVLPFIKTEPEAPPVYQIGTFTPVNFSVIDWNELRCQMIYKPNPLSAPRCSGTFVAPVTAWVYFAERVTL